MFDFRLNHKGIKIIGAFFILSQYGAQQRFECRQKYRGNDYPFVDYEKQQHVESRLFLWHRRTIDRKKHIRIKSYQEKSMNEW